MVGTLANVGSKAMGDDGYIGIGIALSNAVQIAQDLINSPAPEQIWHPKREGLKLP